ncbi:uncharacterized protein N7459_003214 [Penicillium hispanicum]|uniref:uncharacterized protein n=1 Tax=Penicillium hispanicum TaxID=1080232 RepID=UPI002540239C|nr:uncharacterized protein N7459_003214 [Penicillium hispanicum]KAJ5587449.1 hypothetical protein N7459_003214 [Penicillium hispanicum]
MVLSYYYCRSRWTGGPPSDTPKSMEEAQARIDGLYASGVPFFTKANLRSALEQIQRSPARGEKIFLQAVDGATVEFDMRTGEVKPRIDENDQRTEYLFLEPAVMYEARSHLKHRLWWRGFDEERPNLCALEISHRTLIRKPDTKEPIEVKPVPERAEVEEDFRVHRQMWEASAMPTQLKHILASAAAGLEINKIVAVSLGNISWLREDRAGRSAFQHSLVLTMREWVNEKNGRETPCYVQDPAYEDVDLAILGECGMTVLEDPQAWLEMDDTSIVMSVASNVPSKEIVADIARPAVVIWERVGFEDYDKEGETSMTDPCSPRVRAMMEEYDLFEFGPDLEHFGDVVVYVRRTKKLCREGKALDV